MDLPVVTPSVEQHHGLPLYCALREGNLKPIDNPTWPQQPATKHLYKIILKRHFKSAIPVHFTDDPHGVVCRHLVQHVGEVYDVKGLCLQPAQVLTIGREELDIAGLVPELGPLPGEPDKGRNRARYVCRAI